MHSLSLSLAIRQHSSKHSNTLRISAPQKEQVHRALHRATGNWHGIDVFLYLDQQNQLKHFSKTFLSKAAFEESNTQPRASRYYKDYRLRDSLALY